MALLPSKLPLWAYLAAGGAGFLVARTALGQGSGPAAVTAPATPGASAAGGGGGPAGLAGNAGTLWDQYGDQFAQFGPGGSIGIPPTPSGAITLSDLLGGQPIVITAPSSTAAPAPSPTDQQTTSSGGYIAPPTPTTSQVTFWAGGAFKVWTLTGPGPYPTIENDYVGVSPVPWSPASATTFTAEGKRVLLYDAGGSQVATAWKILSGPYAGKAISGSSYQYTL